MKYFWITFCVLAVILGGYYYYNDSQKPQSSSHKLHYGKAILMTKTRDHEALWIHYKYKDLDGNPHEMSEKVPYIDVWEKLTVGDEIDIVYNDDGISVLQVVAEHMQKTK